MMKRILAISVAILVQAPALCGSASPGTIAGMLSVPATSGGPPPTFMFETTGTRASPPSCATVPGRWAIDGSTVGGQQAISTILAAQAQGRSVAVNGTGTCSVWPDTETAGDLEVQPFINSSTYDSNVLGAHVIWLTAQNAPNSIIFKIDKAVGSCAIGAFLTMPSTGATDAQRSANGNAQLAMLMTARATGSALQVYVRTDCSVASIISQDG